MSIANEISALATDRQDIATAITNKGGTVNAGDGFDNFATDIGTIPTGGINPSLLDNNGNRINFNYLFYTCSNLTSIPNNLDFHNATSL